MGRGIAVLVMKSKRTSSAAGRRPIEFNKAFAWAIVGIRRAAVPAASRCGSLTLGWFQSEGGSATRARLTSR